MASACELNNVDRGIKTTLDAYSDNAHIPHPDDIIVDFQTGRVHFKGPMTKEEKAEWDLWISHKHGFIDELAFLQAQLEKSPSEAHRAEIMQDIDQTIKVLETLETFETGRKEIK